jgi:cytochrome c biogenesis protein CcmG/thiol:disulfide interchange protein DsbE
MPKSMRGLLPLALFAVLVALLFFGLGTDPRKVPSPLVGKPVPKFNLPTLQDPNRTDTDADLHGQVSLVNVSISSSVSSRAEHRHFMAIAL